MSANRLKLNADKTRAALGRHAVTTKITSYRKKSTEIRVPKSQTPCDEITK